MEIERIKHIFASIDTMRSDQFTERELELLESFERQFQRGWVLSSKQVEILEDIYKRAQRR